MEKINFANITNTNQNNLIYSNENIILFDDNDYEMNAILDPKKYNKKEFDKIMIQMKEKIKSLMQKSTEIINKQNFSFKNFLTNNLNIQVLAKEEKNIFTKSNITSINNNFNNKSFNSNESSINLNGSNLIMKKSRSKNHFKVIETNNFSNNNYSQNSGEINSPKLIGKKRKSDNKEKKKEEIKDIFEEILDQCKDISNFNNDIFKKEIQNSINSDNDSIETILKINNNPIATIYLNGDIINKIFVFRNQKYYVQEHEILFQLKQIKKTIISIKNKMTNK